MKELLATWVIIQLIVIGIVGGGVINDCILGVDRERPSEPIPVYVSAIFPLIYFVDVRTMECHNNEE